MAARGCRQLGVGGGLLGVLIAGRPCKHGGCQKPLNRDICTTAATKQALFLPYLCWPQRKSPKPASKTKGKHPRAWPRVGLFFLCVPSSGAKAGGRGSSTPREVSAGGQRGC